MKIFMLYLLLQGALAIDKSWWRHTTMYEIFIWSFKDSNGDGIGDIKGVTSTLNHFVDLKIETLYLTPFFKSPMQDSGYDVSNYTAVDPLFGTIQDFEELTREMKQRGLKLVMDLVINHSSDKHEWFEKSIKGIAPYDNYYIWKNPKGYNADGSPNPPNNWMSLFGGSAWEWNEERGQFYFHQFSAGQPDLNLRNKELKREIYDMIRFWLDKGVAGMRLDATKHFIEDALFRDEPVKNASVMHSPPEYHDYKHIYTTDLWESYQFIHDIRNFVDKYSAEKNDIERILMAEAYSGWNATMSYYGTKDYPIAQFPFNFQLFRFTKELQTAEHFNSIMQKWLDRMPKGGVANWNVENHDNPRVGTRLNQEFSDIMVITVMTAPGVAYIYYGQEIGMTNHLVRPDQRRDQNNDAHPGSNTRDAERVPMQWDDSINAGFTGNRVSWLPVNSNYWRVNVESEIGDPNSRYNNFKTLSALRKTKTLKHGRFQSYVLSTWVFAFSRMLKGHDTYIVVHNLGSETELVDLHINIKGLPKFLEVVASSANSGYRNGTKIPSRPRLSATFLMRPISSVVLRAASQRTV